MSRLVDIDEVHRLVRIVLIDFEPVPGGQRPAAINDECLVACAKKSFEQFGVMRPVLTLDHLDHLQAPRNESRRQSSLEEEGPDYPSFFVLSKIYI
jgi:hypothetical protein